MLRRDLSAGGMAITPFLLPIGRLVFSESRSLNPRIESPRHNAGNARHARKHESTVADVIGMAEYRHARDNHSALRSPKAHYRHVHNYSLLCPRRSSAFSASR